MCVTSATSSTNVPGSERVTICRQRLHLVHRLQVDEAERVLRKCVAAKVKRMSPEAILSR